jgi:hypothetical protein
MDREQILTALQHELQRHSFDTFVDHPPSIAQGGRGVVVPGCPACKKRFQTSNQFMEHLTADVLPQIVKRVIPE